MLEVQYRLMKIAMLGTRGIPASYSGFETCVEELGVRLVQRGHQVTVYCRSHHIAYEGEYYRGMRLVTLPTIQNKYLDTITHTLISAVHACFQPYDVSLLFIVGNSPITLIPRLAGQKVVLNVDGLDWKRQKWPLLAKWYIRFSERLSTVLPHEIITDSKVIAKYYQDTYGSPSTYIAYGANVSQRPPGRFLSEYGLERDKYILFVGRLVPENCVHHLVDAFQRLNSQDLKCVIVGDAPYAEDYIAELKDVHSPRIIFTGYLFGEGYRELSSNALLFVETSGVGGTHPAILEAMAFGNCVVVHNTPENLETIGDAGLSYDGKTGAMSLRERLEYLIADPRIIKSYREKALQRVREYYSWDKVTEDYESLFRRLLYGDSMHG